MKPRSTARRLDPAEIVKTLEALRERMEHRFPGSGLGRVCADLLEIARHSAAKTEWLSRPILLIRAAAAFLILLILAAFLASFSLVKVPAGTFDIASFVQMVDAGISELVFVGVAIFFLVSVETRLKRTRALKDLHELRAVAHVIDMHQLTKDPDRLASPPGSKDRPMGPFELGRYLDYCSEMLSLTGKIAALYAQNLGDPQVLSAVNEIESLTDGLSRKVWQKISILNARRPLQNS